MKKLITTLFLVLLSNYSQGQESYSLTVNVFDLRNSNGNILFLLYNKDGTIPDEKIKNYYKKEVGTISMNSSTITFNNIPKGNYAVFILHDENKNGKIDKKFILPIEGIGFSNYQNINLTNRPNFSKASFKIIVIGGQVLNSVAENENYSNYSKEKEKLLKEILDNKIKGVLFISGDRHFTEFSEVPRENTYPLFDWTVSPLTSGVASKNVLKENNVYRTKGSLIMQHNFGTISFLGSKDNRQMKLTVFDAAGSELWNKTILQKDLQ